MFIFWLIAFPILMFTLFSIEKKLSKLNEQNSELIELLKGRDKDE
ncbi:hypothetical protein AB3N04_04915 [Alkalihalophilus sp. As8PL]|uniref:CcmD family protein n=2 Tax=Alkalihalophilus TaxID=2893060 RepID=A0AB39BVG0_9BACI|nr:hypothetical protein [Alkalihalophilus lindianensis]MDV2682923.1 hypothetical protein [Alkalihalophilus lindianensis]